MAEERRSSAKNAVVEKVVIPLAAAAASAAGGYLAKKAPSFLEKTLLPKLREAGRGAGGSVDALSSGAKSALGGTRDVAETLAERAQAVTRKAAGSRRRLSNDELDRRQRTRAEHRAERRKATT